jgi:hypothetical protein
MHMACEICGLARENHPNPESDETSASSVESLIAGWKAGRLVYA